MLEAANMGLHEKTANGRATPLDLASSLVDHVGTPAA